MKYLSENILSAILLIVVIALIVAGISYDGAVDKRQLFEYDGSSHGS